MRRYGESVDPRRRYRTRPGAYAIVAEGRDLLLTEKLDAAEIQLPGGGIDAGEGALAALHRECLEETGWTVRVIRRLGAFQRYCYMPDYDEWARKVCHVYLCAPVLRRGPPADAQHRALWIPRETARDRLAVEGDRRFVAALR